MMIRCWVCLSLAFALSNIGVGNRSAFAQNLTDESRTASAESPRLADQQGSDDLKNEKESKSIDSAFEADNGTHLSSEEFDRKDPIDQSPGNLRKIFEGDFQDYIPDDAPQTLEFRKPFTRALPDGRFQTSYSTILVNLKSETQSPENIREIVAWAVQRDMEQCKQALQKSESEAEKSRQLEELRRLFKLRFDLETAYQDFVVSRIEARAQKLRSRVDARLKATEKWVDAQVTLQRMKSEGIDINDAESIEQPRQATVSANSTFSLPQIRSSSPGYGVDASGLTITPRLSPSVTPSPTTPAGPSQGTFQSWKPNTSGDDVLRKRLPKMERRQPKME